VKRDEEREDSVEARHSSHSHKRKERELSEERDFEDKKIRVSVERRERRKFGDKVKKEEEEEEHKVNGDDKIGGISEASVKEEVTNGSHASASFQDTASVQNVSFFPLF